FNFLIIFQAEDGIRDRNVTGVQTCALTILPCSALISSLMISIIGNTVEDPSPMIDPPVSPEALSDFSSPSVGSEALPPPHAASMNITPSSTAERNILFFILEFLQ